MKTGKKIKSIRYGFMILRRNENKKLLYDHFAFLHVDSDSAMEYFTHTKFLFDLFGHMGC